jgi:hypothetical protein
MYYDVDYIEILRDFKQINIITRYWGIEDFNIINNTLKYLFNNIIEKTKYYTKIEIINLIKSLLQESGITRRVIHVFMHFMSHESYKMYSFEKHNAINDMIDRIII